MKMCKDHIRLNYFQRITEMLKKRIRLKCIYTITIIIGILQIGTANAAQLKAGVAKVKHEYRD